MLSGLAACGVMLALGLPGVVALRRLTDRLTSLEVWAYGLPLGEVVGSLAILVLAIIFRGLSTALVLVVGLVSAVGALLGWRGRAVTRVLGTIFRQPRLGFAVTTTTSTGTATPARRLAVALLAFGPLSTFVLGAFI